MNTQEDRTLHDRQEADRRMLRHSFSDIASLLVGTRGAERDELRLRSSRSSAEEICAYFNFDVEDVASATDKDGTVDLERILRPAGYLSRPVKLEGQWWKESRSVMLGETADHASTIALIPTRFGGYTFYDYRIGHKIVVNRLSATLVAPKATVFLQPFPLKALSAGDVFRYFLGLVRLPDFLLFFLLAALVTALGFLFPAASRYLTGTILKVGDEGLAIQAFCFLCGIALGLFFLQLAKGAMRERIHSGVEVEFQNAIFARLRYLPLSYFQENKSGDVMSQTGAMKRLPQLVTAVLSDGALGTLLSLTLLFQAQLYVGPLIYSYLLILALQLAISLMTAGKMLQLERMHQKRKAALDTYIMNMFEGIQKLKNSGAEKRAFSQWADLYRGVQNPVLRRPVSLVLSQTLIKLIGGLGMMLLSLMAYASGMSASDWISFLVTSGMIGGAFSALVDVMGSLFMLPGDLSLAAPYLEAVPEISEQKQYVDGLEGKIEVNNVRFRYEGSNTDVLDHCTFTIKAGDYVALVGRTGSGKSTLVKLLLGFLKPESGAIYYDDQDLQVLDLPSLRSHIGTVLQDGQLFSGDIRSNIAIMDPTISDDEIKQACEIAGVWDDIASMPMGLHTIVSEGAGGLSGGQKQRIMIARALVTHPKMMVLDEAMNSLDYLTQKRISMHLEQQNCTRIIVSHRLSTIKQCNQILVLSDGRIVESGSFQDLAKPGTLFSKLVHIPEGATCCR